MFWPLDPRCAIVVPKYNPPRTWTPEGTVGIGGPCLSPEALGFKDTVFVQCPDNFAPVIFTVTTLSDGKDEKFPIWSI